MTRCVHMMHVFVHACVFHAWSVVLLLLTCLFAAQAVGVYWSNAFLLSRTHARITPFLLQTRTQPRTISRAMSQVPTSQIGMRSGVHSVTLSPTLAHSHSTHATRAFIISLKHTCTALTSPSVSPLSLPSLSLSPTHLLLTFSLPSLF